MLHKSSRRSAATGYIYKTHVRSKGGPICQYLSVPIQGPSPRGIDVFGPSWAIGILRQSRRVDPDVIRQSRSLGRPCTETGHWQRATPIPAAWRQNQGQLTGRYMYTFSIVMGQLQDHRCSVLHVWSYSRSCPPLRNVLPSELYRIPQSRPPPLPSVRGGRQDCRIRLFRRPGT